MAEETSMSVEERGGVTIVSFPNDSALDAGTIEKIQQELQDIVASRRESDIVLDFSNVRFFSSRSIGVLIQVRKRADAVGPRLVLSAVRPELQRVFQITRLTEIFKVYEDNAAAVAALTAK